MRRGAALVIAAAIVVACDATGAPLEPTGDPAVESSTTTAVVREARVLAPVTTDGPTVSAAPPTSAIPQELVAAPRGWITIDQTLASRAAGRMAVPPRSLLVVATGDVLTEQRVLEVAAAHAASGTRYDFAPMFAPIAGIISGADLAICHMELPIGRPGARPGVYGRSPNGGNLLLAPYELAVSTKEVGYDRCSTASNHSNDLGVDGIVSTLEALDSVGLGHAGTARDDAEAAVSVFDVNGVRIAHLSYTTFANSPPLAEPWMNFGGSVGEVVAAVHAARGAGAELVILSMHIAKEMLSVPMSYDRAFVENITAAARVDLVVEHGPHVIQPVEEINGTPVFWSVGNLLSAMGLPGTGKYEDLRTLDGLVAGVRFTESSPGTFTTEVSAILVCNEKATRTVYAPLTALADEATPAPIRPQLDACISRSAPVVADLR